MIIDILTLFPKFYESPTSMGVIGMALNEKKIDLNIVDMRLYGDGNYKKCDDYTYGGGPGMIMTYSIFKKYFDSNNRGYTLLFSPSGKILTQKKIKELSNKDHITMILGHYEGIDYRVEKKYADEVISIGDYVLSGGEIPALLLVDAVSRYKGVLNNTLLWLGIIDTPIRILNTEAAVIIGLVYILLPFMILPLYSSIEKLDYRLLEAAKDLGANAFQRFIKIILPLTMPGIIAGCLLVLLPAMGMFYVADLLGGAKVLLVGNVIKSEFLISRNWPFGSSISIALTILMALLLFVYYRAGKLFNKKSELE